MRIARSTKIWIAVGGLAALLTTFAVNAGTAFAQTAAAAPRRSPTSRRASRISRPTSRTARPRR